MGTVVITPCSTNRATNYHFLAERARALVPAFNNLTCERSILYLPLLFHDIKLICAVAAYLLAVDATAYNAARPGLEYRTDLRSCGRWPRD